MRADCFSKKSDTNFPPLSYQRHKSKKNIEIQHIFLRGGIYLKSVAGIYLDGQYIILRFHPARVWAFADPFSGFKVKYAVFSSMSVKLCSGCFDTSLVSIPHLLLQKSYILSINKHSVKYKKNNFKHEGEDFGSLRLKLFRQYSSLCWCIKLTTFTWVKANLHCLALLTERVAPCALFCRK